MIRPAFAWFDFKISIDLDTVSESRNLNQSINQPTNQLDQWNQ